MGKGHVDGVPTNNHIYHQWLKFSYLAPLLLEKLFITSSTVEFNVNVSDQTCDWALFYEINF